MLLRQKLSCEQTQISMKKNTQVSLKGWAFWDKLFQVQLVIAVTMSCDIVLFKMLLNFICNRNKSHSVSCPRRSAIRKRSDYFRSVTKQISRLFQNHLQKYSNSQLLLLGHIFSPEHRKMGEDTRLYHRWKRKARHLFKTLEWVCVQDKKVREEKKKAGTKKGQQAITTFCWPSPSHILNMKYF